MPITYAISKNGGILTIGKGHITGSEIKGINESGVPHLVGPLLM
jgi:hypothetical protein